MTVLSSGERGGGKSRSRAAENAGAVLRTEARQRDFHVVGRALRAASKLETEGRIGQERGRVHGRAKVVV